MSVTPITGVFTQPDDATMSVTPVTGAFTQPDDATMSVTPVTGAFTQPDDATMSVTPVTGAFTQPDDAVPTELYRDKYDVMTPLALDDYSDVVNVTQPVYSKPEDRENSEQESKNQTVKSQRSDTSQTINLNASFSIDGSIIDRKIIKVVDGLARTAIDDLSSSTRG